MYKKWGYNTFEDYCQEELKLHHGAVYEIMHGTLLLMRDDPELYQRLLQGNTKKNEILPSYRSLYLLTKKRKLLGEEKFQELFHGTISGELSTRLVQIQIQAVQKKSKKSVSKKTALKEFEKAIRLIEKCGVSENFVSEAENLLNRMRGKE